MPEPATAATAGLLIISRSGRALAVSARRAGYACAVIDAYLDSDTRATSEAGWHCPATFSRGTLQPLLSAWRQQTTGGCRILAGSGFEHDPGLLDWLREFGDIVAVSAATVALLKDPARFFPLLDRLGIPHPRVALTAEAAGPGDWLSKKPGSEGGIGVRPWTPAQPLPAGCYLQERLAGEPASVVFLADGHDSRLIGFNWCRLSGLGDWQFGGAIRWQPQPVLARSLKETVQTLVSATGLRGLCGMDILLQADGFQVLEVNPRPPASFELHEGGNSLVAAHIAACDGRLTDWQPPVHGSPGKRIVFVPARLTISAGFMWPDWTADRPVAGTVLERGEPLCTIFAWAASPEACRERLRRRRHQLLTQLNKIIQPIEINELTNWKEETA